MLKNEQSHRHEDDDDSEPLEVDIFMIFQILDREYNDEEEEGEEGDEEGEEDEEEEEEEEEEEGEEEEEEEGEEGEERKKGAGIKITITKPPRRRAATDTDEPVLEPEGLSDSDTEDVGAPLLGVRLEGKKISIC